MNTVEILKAARELISDEKRWTRGCYARDDSGDTTSPDDHLATCYCAVGALYKATDKSVFEKVPADVIFHFAVDEAVVMYPRLSDEGKVVEFNDTHTHPEVLALFDRAISRAEGGAA